MDHILVLITIYRRLWNGQDDHHQSEVNDISCLVYDIGQWTEDLHQYAEKN